MKMVTPKAASLERQYLDDVAFFAMQEKLIFKYPN